jgi:glycosyltransferase involved in cell wall biosynthesis
MPDAGIIEASSRMEADSGTEPSLDLAAPAVLRPPHLTIDIGPLLESQWTGIPVFTRRLVESVLRDGRIELTFSFNLTSIPQSRVIAAIKAGTGTFLRQEYEEQAGKGLRPIDTHQPILYPSVKSASFVCEKEASTIHDISTLVMPENHEEANIDYHLNELAEELASDDVVFCVSDATKVALETYFPSIRTRTKILYQYADWPDYFKIMDRNLPRLRIGRYAAVIGTIEPRKNLSILLRALSLPALERSDIKFVVIGKVGWLVETFLSELTPSQRNRIIFSGFVSEFVKYRLIAGCEFMVFPSIYEGFGIPALEALSLGKPVLGSRTSSFPEVIGDAGIYFDPMSVDDFVEKLEIIEDKTMLDELSSKAIGQSEQFGWRRMASPIVDWSVTF